METVPFPGQPQKWLSTSLGHEEMHQGRPSSLHLHSNSLLNTAQATCSDKVSFKKLFNYKGPSFEYFVIFTLRSKQIEKATNPWPDYITAGRFTEEIRRVTWPSWPLPFLWVKNFIPAGRIRPPHPHICMWVVGCDVIWPAHAKLAEWPLRGAGAGFRIVVPLAVSLVAGLSANHFSSSLHSILHFPFFFVFMWTFWQVQGRRVCCHGNNGVSLSANLF